MSKEQPTTQELIEWLRPLVEQMEKERRNKIPGYNIIINKSQLERKQILEEQLWTWILIKNEQDLHYLKNNGITNIITPFNEINAGKSFILIKDNNETYPITVLDTHEDLNIIRLWFISNNWFFKYSLSWYQRRIERMHPWLSPTTLEIEDEKSKHQIIPPPIQESKPPEKPTEIKHTIKKWEFLWKIISEQYQLDSEKDKNAIWQIMEIIRKDPRNKKAIKDIDTIFTWEKLYLPKNVKLPQWKWKEDKEIILKEKEAK